MPRERFSENHTFLPKRAFLSFEEIEKVVRSCMSLGLEKVRITGGEPLLRKGDCLIVHLKDCKYSSTCGPTYMSRRVTFGFSLVNV